MTNVFIIHGTYGHPKENWFPWLQSEIGRIGYDAYVPQFPTPENQTVDAWMEALKKYERFIDEETIFVGHSLGCAFILNLLEIINHPIKAVFLVGGYFGPANHPEFSKLNDGFADKKFNWKKIKGRCEKFYILSSDNDHYIPLDRGIDLAEKLGAEFIIIKNGGHINEASGYTKFHLLLQMIEEELK